MERKTENSIKDTIYHAVLEGILNCEYQPGQVINEKELTTRFECSKSPVREALVALCNDNVLRNIPRYGYEIIRLTREDIDEMMQVRYLLEGGMLIQNLSNIGPAQIEKLKQLDAACAVASDIWGHWECNENFHRQMMAFCRNDFAYHELDRILGRLKRAYAQFYWTKWDASLIPYDTKNHSQIISSIQQQDSNMLLGALKNDLEDFGNLSIALYDPYGDGITGSRSK